MIAFEMERVPIECVTRGHHHLFYGGEQDHVLTFRATTIELGYDLRKR
jgi:hypothetical protein